jgi:hypothetical protein
MPTNNINNIFSYKCPYSSQSLINQAFKFDFTNREGHCLFCFLNSNCYEFQWRHQIFFWMYCMEQIFKGVMFTSLEPLFGLGVARGMVCFPH